LNSCVQTVSHSKIKVEENGRKVIFLNPSRAQFMKGRIDGCLVTSGIRADYFVGGEGKTVLIELKGSNIEHAFEQLLKAAEHSNVKSFLRARPEKS